MKSWIPTVDDRRVVASLVELAFKNGAVRDTETGEMLSELKRRALSGLPKEEVKSEEVKK